MEDEAFEEITQKIEAHPRYGPAMRQAVAEKADLVLNYHNHGPTGPEGYCVSICKRGVDDSPMGLMGLNENLEELVHIKGFGRDEGDCIPLSAALGRALKSYYLLRDEPEIYLNGKPFPTIN